MEEPVWRKLWSCLFGDLSEDDDYPAQRPLLAHYTSLDVLEKILSNEEILLSNPLFMNDIKEIRFGVNEGSWSFRQNETLKRALGSDSRHQAFWAAFDAEVSYFEKEHLLDTYVFCLSEHEPDDMDGLLSMWRGYGGNGQGVAIVFDTAKLTPPENTPLVLAKVRYETNAASYAWFEAIAERFAQFISDAAVPDEHLNLAAHALFDRLKLFALFTKHRGFDEEREWRLVYVSERDPERRLKSMLSYMNGHRGVQPKLRLRLAPLEGVISGELSIENLVDRILLGPSHATPLAERSVKRMLELIGKPQLCDRVHASSIPYRPT